MDWLADTLGQLVARHGVYYVLGNHDCSVDLGRLRRTLDQSGLIDLGGRWIMIEIGGTPVVLAGNERPWIDAAADLRTCPPAAPAGPLRIALAHTPDQFAWARAEEVDLLLVGHTHGGQIRLPPLGAIFTPSTKGVKYISGIDYAAPHDSARHPRRLRRCARALELPAGNRPPPPLRENGASRH